MTTDTREALAALTDLESVLCDPEGRASIRGSEGDLKIIDAALAVLRAALATQPAQPNPWHFEHGTDEAGTLHVRPAAAQPSAQGEALRKDAERYRWLRIQDNDDFEFAIVKNPHFDVYASAVELDSDIDAAIAATKEQQA